MNRPGTCKITHERNDQVVLLKPLHDVELIFIRQKAPVMRAAIVLRHQLRIRRHAHKAAIPAEKRIAEIWTRLEEGAIDVPDAGLILSRQLEPVGLLEAIQYEAKVGIEQV